MLADRGKSSSLEGVIQFPMFCRNTGTSLDKERDIHPNRCWDGCAFAAGESVTIYR
jgi:hypothetical protein